MAAGGGGRVGGSSPDLEAKGFVQLMDSLEEFSEESTPEKVDALYQNIHALREEKLTKEEISNIVSVLDLFANTERKTVKEIAVLHHKVEKLKAEVMSFVYSDAKKDAINSRLLEAAGDFAARLKDHDKESSAALEKFVEDFEDVSSEEKLVPKKQQILHILGEAVSTLATGYWKRHHESNIKLAHDIFEVYEEAVSDEHPLPAQRGIVEVAKSVAKVGLTHFSELGSGGSGIVYFLSDFGVVAKQIRNPKRAWKEVSVELSRGILADLEGISVPFTAVYAPNNTMYLLSHVVPGQDLVSLSSRLSPSVVFNLDVIRNFCDGVYTIAEMHNRGIINGDLKGENILLTPEGKLKIIDFGLSAKIGEEQSGGTLTALAADDLELLDRKKEPRAIPPRDYFGYGIAIVELLTRTSPFANIIVQYDFESKKRELVFPRGESEFKMHLKIQKYYLSNRKAVLGYIKERVEYAIDLPKGPEKTRYASLLTGLVDPIPEKRMEAVCAYMTTRRPEKSVSRMSAEEHKSPSPLI